MLWSISIFLEIEGAADMVGGVQTVFYAANKVFLLVWDIRKILVDRYRQRLYGRHFPRGKITGVGMDV